MNRADRKQMSPAFLLHRRDYSNNSLLVECFTESEGRFPAIAKGVKGKSKSGSGLLQPFTPLHISVSGRGEVKNLTRFESAEPILNLSGKALYCGFYVNEVLTRLLQRNDPHEQLFRKYSNLILHLSKQGVDEAALRYFELDLLHELGYGVSLLNDADRETPIEEDKPYRFVPDLGLVQASNTHDGYIMGETLVSLHNRSLKMDKELAESRWLLRRVLSFHLGGRPLKSRELFRQLYLD